jgi:hypothetical protein
VDAFAASRAVAELDQGGGRNGFKTILRRAEVARVDEKTAR